MSKKTLFNRVDTIKDKTARAELARAHAMIALLSATSIILLITLHASVDIPVGLVLFAATLLALVVLFSAGVAYSMRNSRK